MPAPNGLRRFDPRKLARYETQNYIAYYRKDWLRLLVVSVSMVKEGFGLSWPQAIYGAYLVARAEIAFAPVPDNDVPKAQAIMRRFFQLLNRVHGLSIDVDRAAKIELDWWIAHRRLFANADNEGLVEALAQAAAITYGIEPERVRQAAYHRAQGMLHSDLWVNAGKAPDDPRLAQEEEELYQGYAALRQALQADA